MPFRTSKEVPKAGWKTRYPRRFYGSGHTVKEIIRRLEADGWRLLATKGSHRQFTHATKKGRVTVPGKLSADCNRAR